MLVALAPPALLREIPRSTWTLDQHSPGGGSSVEEVIARERRESRSQTSFHFLIGIMRSFD